MKFHDCTESVHTAKVAPVVQCKMLSEVTGLINKNEALMKTSVIWTENVQ